MRSSGLGVEASIDVDNEGREMMQKMILPGDVPVVIVVHLVNRSRRNLIITNGCQKFIQSALHSRHVEWRLNREIRNGLRRLGQTDKS